jgi:uncharacterized protein (DUF2147 family)
LRRKGDKKMKHRWLGFALFLMVSIPVPGQVSTLLGDWITVDDKTGEQRSIVTLYKGQDGLYYGKISKMLMYADMRCDRCTGADHNAPIEGLVIIRGMKYNEKDNQLQEGRVLDPESGNFYYGKIYLKDGKLVLRGSIDKRGFLGRNQTWLRKTK